MSTINIIKMQKCTGLQLNDTATMQQTAQLERVLGAAAAVPFHCSPRSFTHTDAGAGRMADALRQLQITVMK